MILIAIYYSLQIIFTKREFFVVAHKMHINNKSDSTAVCTSISVVIT